MSSLSGRVVGSTKKRERKAQTMLLELTAGMQGGRDQ